MRVSVRQSSQALHSLRSVSRWVTGAAAGAFVVLSSPSFAIAAPVEMNAEEYKLYKDYTSALTDERVMKIPEKKRLAAIAKNFKVPEKKLKAAIEKGEQYGHDAGKNSEAEVRALLEASDLKGRISEIRVDADEGHVVTYVAWKNEKGEKLEEEASLVALLTAKGAPIASTIALWSTDAASAQKVFEATISAEAASRFQQERIPMFAAARYIRVFENVRNAYKGTPPAN